ncbi:MAG: TetR/AcrR family transcriptional regulator [Sarcina sp.]
MSRKEQAKLTKEKIFNTAVKLINEKGFDRVTVSEICAESKVAKGTFYVHFQSKEDIIKENYEESMSDYVLGNFDNFILNEYEDFAKNNPEKSIKEKIIRFLLSELVYANHMGYDLTSRVYITNISDSIKGNNSHFKNRDFLPLLKELLIEGINSKVFNSSMDLDQLIFYIESFTRGVMTTWCLDGGSFDIVKVGEENIRQLIENL